MVFNLVGLLIGLVILVAGVINFVKEKEDPESRKIFGIASGIGAVIAIFMIIRMISG